MCLASPSYISVLLATQVELVHSSRTLLSGAALGVSTPCKAGVIRFACLVRNECALPCPLISAMTAKFACRSDSLPARWLCLTTGLSFAARRKNATRRAPSRQPAVVVDGHLRQAARWTNLLKVKSHSSTPMPGRLSTITKLMLWPNRLSCGRFREPLPNFNRKYSKQRKIFGDCSFHTTNMLWQRLEPRCPKEGNQLSTGLRAPDASRIHPVRLEEGLGEAQGLQHLLSLR